ncbi:MAG: hypothetical protein II008_17485 [Oscillospiraceae bacterium]|nr:hypothetical protein [Oscillospiraceae bacterium]
MKPEEKITLLKQAWKEVFGVDEVADDADFFEEGGDSIMAVQLSSWLVQKGVKLDLGKIFYTPVLSDMAETLEETDAMFVPEELLTKDIMQKKLDEVMQEPSSPQGDDDQQICDPETMEQEGTAPDQQICDPETMEQEGTAPDQQICDPETMQPAGTAPDQQICDPETMQPAGAAPDQQICDPETMQPSAAAFDQQLCDPEAGRGLPPQAYGNMTSQKMMGAMLKLMIAQQQTVLQMMEIMADMIAPPAGRRVRPPMKRNMPGAFFRPPVGAGKNKPFMQQLPDEKKEKMKKAMAPYISRKVDQPIEQPTVIGIAKAKVNKPVRSAEEVLEHVLSGLLKKGFNKTDDLFEQGLTSLDTVKIVTRCGEHGYGVKMQDIYMHSTFDELVKCMTPGE